MTKKKINKNLPKDSSVLIATGIAFIVLSPMVWIVINEIYKVMREESSCNLTCVIAGASGVYIGTGLVVIVGLVLFISGIIKYLIEKKSVTKKN